MWLPILAIWGCIPEFTKRCIDMTNSSSAYLGVAGGIAIGAVIGWWAAIQLSLVSFPSWKPAQLFVLN